MSQPFVWDQSVMRVATHPRLRFVQYDEDDNNDFFLILYVLL